MQSRVTLKKRGLHPHNVWLALLPAMLLACSPYTPPTTPPPTGDTIPPGIPSGLTAQVGDRAVNLSWAANMESDLKRYTVQYGTSASNLTTVRHVDRPQTTLQLTGLTNDTAYYFAVKAEDTTGNLSALSTTVSATPKGSTTPPPDTEPPAVPRNLVAEAGDQSVKLTWTANTEADLQSYQVLFGTSAGSLNQTATLGKGQQTTTLSNLTNGTTYFFALKALDSSGNVSAPSSPVTATPSSTTTPPPQDLPPAMPQGFRATAPDNEAPGRLKLEWNPNTEPDLKGYTLYFTQRRSEVVQSVFIERKETAYTLTDLPNNTQYDLQLEAVDQVGNRSPRASTSATTRALKQVSVVSSTPQNASRGQPRATTMTVTFSDDMDKTSVEGAFKLTINSVQRGATFAWTGQRTLTITPSAPLAYGDQVRWSVNTSAKSVSGGPLASQFESEFKLMNLVTRTFMPSQAQTGVVSRIKLPNSSTITKTSKTTELIIGDEYDVGNKFAHRSFMGFDFSDLPEDIPRFVSATLSITYNGFKGDVFGKLGHVELHRVKFGPTLENSTWDSPRLNCISFECYRGSSNAPSTFDVQDMFESDWAGRNVLGKISQFSLHMVKDTNNDNNDEYVKYANPSLTVSYEYP